MTGTKGNEDLDVALFVDVDNIWLSARNDDLPFQPRLIHEQARLQGRVILARAYGDWSEGYLREARLRLQEEAFDLVQLPGDQKGKNTADIQLALDALEVALSARPPQIIVIVSGDRDFVPLANKLKQHRVKVVGIAAASSAGRQFRNACDQYIEYDDLVGQPAEPMAVEPVPVDTEAHAKEEGPDIAVTKEVSTGDFSSREELEAAIVQAAREDEVKRLVARAVDQIISQGGIAYGAAVMQMMQRLDNSFTLSKYPKYPKFLDLVRDAESADLITVSKPGPGKDIELSLTTSGRASNITFVHRPSFGTYQEEAEHYASVLRNKRVTVVQHPWRGELVRALFGALDAEGLGLSIREMNDWIVRRAAELGLSESKDALRKLVWSLNLAHCFTDKYGFPGEQRDEDMLCKPAVEASEAVDRIERRFVSGVLLEEPDAPLNAEAVALWLFGSETDKAALERSETLIKAAHQNRR